MAEAIIIYEGEVVSKLPKFRVNDFGSTITFHLINNNTTALDLTGKTVTLKADKIDEFKNNVIDESCSITDATKGYCEVTIPASTLISEESLHCYLEIVEVGTVVKTIDLGFLHVYSL